MKKQVITSDFKTILKITKTKSVPTFRGMLEKDRKYHIAVFKWELIVKAYNILRDKKWKADYLNENQYKYYPWCQLKKDKSQPSGFAFSDSAFNYSYTFTRVGSRQFFQTSDDVMDALEKFGQIYIETRIYN